MSSRSFLSFAHLDVAVACLDLRWALSSGPVGSEPTGERLAERVCPTSELGSIVPSWAGSFAIVSRNHELASVVSGRTVSADVALDGNCQLRRMTPCRIGRVGRSRPPPLSFDENMLFPLALPVVANAVTNIQPFGARFEAPVPWFACVSSSRWVHGCRLKCLGSRLSAFAFRLAEHVPTHKCPDSGVVSSGSRLLLTDRIP